jgi:hypothetical protein
LSAAQHRIEITELSKGRRQDASFPKGVRVNEGGIREEYSLVRAQGQGIAQSSNPFLSGDGQSSDLSGCFFLDLHGYLQSVLVKGADNQGVLPPNLLFTDRINLELARGDLWVNNLFKANYDMHFSPRPYLSLLVQTPPNWCSFNLELMRCHSEPEPFTSFRINSAETKPVLSAVEGNLVLCIVERRLLKTRFFVASPSPVPQ